MSDINDPNFFRDGNFERMYEEGDARVSDAKLVDYMPGPNESVSDAKKTSGFYRRHSGAGGQLDPEALAGGDSAGVSGVAGGVSSDALDKLADQILERVLKKLGG